MGEVIQLADKLHRVCGDCENAYMNCYGAIYCRIFDEMIVDDRTAYECAEFSRS